MRLGRSEGCPVTPLPVLSEHGTCPARRDPVHDEAGLVADDHDDTLDPCRKQVPYGTTSQAEAASIDALAQIVVSRIQGVKGVTRTLTCSVVHI